MATNSILVTLAHSYLSGILKTMTPEEVNHFDRIIGELVEGKLQFDEAEKRLRNIVDISSCLDKLKAILEVDDTPLPENPDVTNSPDGSRRKKTRTWSANEDNRLIKGVHKYGFDNWNIIASFVGNSRTRSQCSQRWLRVIDPRICRDHFTEEEDKQLLKLVELYGDKMWTKVAAGMGNRSDVQCRYRYKQLPHRVEKTVEIPKEKAPIIPQISSNSNNHVHQHPLYAPPSSEPLIPPFTNHKITQPPGNLPPIIISPAAPAIPPIQVHQPIHPIPAVQSISQPIQPPPFITNNAAIPPAIIGPQIVQPPILPMIQQVTPTVNFALPPIQPHGGDGKNLSLDAPIPLRNSMDIFKSDSLFDSSFWN